MVPIYYPPILSFQPREAKPVLSVERRISRSVAG
ncbi:hypothetical protein GGQ79_003757 [Ochrobactrum pecoris]|uniref:Uncharacterized protein n=1 Tax=Brucella pecoris TaxID=867683 RepID=A0AB34YVE0_9HYPH|nr:hypothetical protein [Brucella pecoris]